MTVLARPATIPSDLSAALKPKADRYQRLPLFPPAVAEPSDPTATFGRKLPSLFKTR
ncbi:hypothetical protein [Neomoorella humiferrea]|uniref:hypothetical protein n=1 Tax=Neomoorella humiferrea TaxID=676965 RepID=UPI003D94FE7E